MNRMTNRVLIISLLLIPPLHARMNPNYVFVPVFIVGSASLASSLSGKKQTDRDIEQIDREIQRNGALQDKGSNDSQERQRLAKLQTALHAKKSRLVAENNKRKGDIFIASAMIGVSGAGGLATFWLH
jgi:hypothetical protein